jgi:hypothetical protein
MNDDKGMSFQRVADKSYRTGTNRSDANRLTV